MVWILKPRQTRKWSTQNFSLKTKPHWRIRHRLWVILKLVFRKPGTNTGTELIYFRTWNMTKKYSLFTKVGKFRGQLSNHIFRNSSVPGVCTHVTWHWKGHEVRQGFIRTMQQTGGNPACLYCETLPYSANTHTHTQRDIILGNYISIVPA